MSYVIWKCIFDDFLVQNDLPMVITQELNKLSEKPFYLIELLSFELYKLQMRRLMNNYRRFVNKSSEPGSPEKPRGF